MSIDADVNFQSSISKFIFTVFYIHGHHLSGKPGNVRDFDICQGNIRDFTKSQGSVREKISSAKSGQTVYCWNSCLFACIRVFSSIQLVINVNYAYIIMESFLIIDKH